MQQTSDQSNAQLLEGEYGSTYGDGTAAVVNNNSQQPALFYTTRGKNNWGCCAPIPRPFQGIFAAVIVLGFLEYLGMIVNELNQADVLIYVGNSGLSVEEYAWVGWNKLELWSSTRMLHL